MIMLQSKLRSDLPRYLKGKLAKMKLYKKLCHIMELA